MRRISSAGRLAALACTAALAATLAAAACGGDDTGGVTDDEGGAESDGTGGAQDGRSGADATSGGDDASADVTTTDGSGDAGSDADARASDAANDAADSSLVTRGLDAGDGGPTGPSLLVSDPGASRIDLVDTSGSVLATYAAPVANVAGIAFDRRLHDGFWVVGHDSGRTISKIAWSGAALPAVTTVASHTAFRGLDYYLGATAADDQFVFVCTNSGGIEVADGVSVATTSDVFSMGFYNGGFQTGFWGVSFLAFDGGANVMQGWYSHSSSATIELWQTASFQSSVALSGIAAARGMARTPSGELWVVDEITHHVTHLSSTGTVLGGFDTPGTQPAGLSYDPGP